ncbi:MAG: cytochrome c biogenesis protein CcsA [Bacteroidia bacterium]|nr:cytochrome c biogenesis protein CcsA [Bacteroidia bacterium]MDW8089566.1 cytochrome c biogenesis protein CcsA [Bacteroidia bacterium]
MRLSAGIAIGALLGTFIAAFWGRFPPLAGLGWSDRNLFFHVPMWFSMYALMGLSFFWSARYLIKPDPEADCKAREAAKVAMFFGVLGLVTGILWSRVTWAEALPDTDPQAWWGWDPKQTFALIALLMYGAYFVLRQNLANEALRARLASVYGIIATILIFPLTFLLPRYLGGLHPGAEGTPAFRPEDISLPHRLTFYTSAIGFIALGVWLWQAQVKLAILAHRLATNTASCGTNA